MICIVSNPKRLNEAQQKAVEDMLPFARHIVREMCRMTPALTRLDPLGIAHLTLMSLVAGRTGAIPAAYVRKAIRNAVLDELRREQRLEAMPLTLPLMDASIARTERSYEGTVKEYLKGFTRPEQAILKQWATFPVHESIRSVAAKIGVNYQTLGRLVKRLPRQGE